MRRLLIAALSALTLLCVSISTPQGRGVRSICEDGAARGRQRSVSLEPGKPIERELSGAQSHSYQIALNSGQYLRITVDQQGIDALVALFTPDGKKIGEMDGERATVGLEIVSAIAAETGAYRIDVRSSEKTAQTGRYEIKIEELRNATAEDNHRVAAESLFREAELLRRGTLEEKRKGVEKYQEALELYRKAGDRKGEAEALSNSGEAYYSLGETRKALEMYNEALPIRRSVGDRIGESVTLLGFGEVYLLLGETRKALDHYNEALAISRTAGDRRRAAVALNGFGAVYWSMGEMQKAFEKLNEALPLSRAVGDRGVEAFTLNNIGVVYRLLGDTRKGLEKYNEALAIFRAIGDRRGEAVALNSIGVIYRSLGEAGKAIEKHNEALAILRAMDARKEKAAALTSIGKAAALTSIGVDYHSLGETRKSIEKHNEALAICCAVADRIVEAAALSNIGVVYHSLGEARKAMEMYNEALPLRRAVGDRSGEATALNNIGVVYHSLGETGKALEKFNEALPLRRAVGDRNGEAITLLWIARAELKQGNLTQARQTIDQAVDMIESLRANIAGQEFRASYFATRQDFFETYIDVLMDMHKQNPAAAFDAVAFAASERARARSLLEMLVEASADIRQGVDGSLLERERSLRERLSEKAAAQLRLLHRKHTPAQADAAAKEIASIAAEFDELMALIRARSPGYSALTPPQPLNLAEIQRQVLDPDTLLLEYALGYDASRLFLVSQTSIASYQLPKRTVIEEAARSVRELLIAPQPQPGDTEAKYHARIKEARERYWPQAAALSRMILGPVASQLGGKRLAIVADGALRYIPFAALPVPSPGNDEGVDSGAEPQPLFVEHEIVSLPSASTLAALRRETSGRKPAEKTLAVLADPVFTDDDTRVKRDVGKVGIIDDLRPANTDETDVGFLQMTRSGRETGVLGAEGSFGRLLNARREAAAIAALVPESERLQALDFKASRETALRPELGAYRIVHFATHGLLNDIHPELSGLVLSLVDEEGRPQDGFLRLQDIYNLKLPAELVVLSACHTGLGKEIKGEGLIGLARGFMYAGAPRIVTSLWKVDDRATSELMKRFYQGLLGPEALRPAGALRQAQLSIWKEKQWRAPYYWAAFVLQGEWK